MNKMDLNTKINRSMEIIEAGLARFPKTMLCWSSGKDSMVLLHLLKAYWETKKVIQDFPEVIFFREPWDAKKYQFADQIITQYGLIVWSWHPYKSGFQQAGDEYEVQNHYQVNNTSLTCPTGITPPVEGRPFTCSLDILGRPKQALLEAKQFDALWIGHKGSDSDPILGGDAGTRIEGRILGDQGTMLFPLRDWTDEDIWEYTRKFSVPYDTSRYVLRGKAGKEIESKVHNLDYVHACTRCIDRRAQAPKYVFCPKLRMKIENISAKVPWCEEGKISYIQD